MNGKPKRSLPKRHAPRTKDNPFPIRTEENRTAILDGLANGKPLAVICRDIGVAAHSVYDWKDADAEFGAAIARARDLGFDVIANDVLSIIDTTEEEAASRRVRAEYRLKLLAKWDPKRYGDKLDLTSDNKALPAGPAVAIFALPDNGRD